MAATTHAENSSHCSGNICSYWFLDSLFVVPQVSDEEKRKILRVNWTVYMPYNIPQWHIELVSNKLGENIHGALYSSD